jgi:3-hydroxy-3-methylglutaryl CoA synthase
MKSAFAAAQRYAIAQEEHDEPMMDEIEQFCDAIDAKAAAYDELCAAIEVLLKRVSWYGISISEDTIYDIEDGGAMSINDGTGAGAIAAIIKAANKQEAK